jgi:hypothetical protein
MSNLNTHALTEFRAAGWLDENGNYKDEMQKTMCEGVLELLELFASHGHSGFSAPYAINMFAKLAKFEPLLPLTGEDWEWLDHGYCKQNIRDSRVFKQDDRFNGQAYFIEGIVFFDVLKDEDGEEFNSYYTNSDSFVPITFPYTPHTEFRKRPTE